MSEPTGRWRKSRRSTNNGSACVEARKSGPRFQVRDSKLGEYSPILEGAEHDFTGLLRIVQS